MSRSAARFAASVLLCGKAHCTLVIVSAGASASVWSEPSLKLLSKAPAMRSARGHWCPFGSA